jgi:hypothetical protein
MVSSVGVVYMVSMLRQYRYAWAFLIVGCGVHTFTLRLQCLIINPNCPVSVLRTNCGFIVSPFWLLKKASKARDCGGLPLLLSFVAGLS